MTDEGKFSDQDKGLMEQVSVVPTDDEVTREVYDNSEVTDLLLDGKKISAQEAMNNLGVDASLNPGPKTKPEPQKISIGRTVIYRSRTGNYSVPAIVNCTVDSIYQPGVEHGFVPALSKVDNVHLTVLTPGKPGLRKLVEEVDGELPPGVEKFVNPSPHPVSENVAGCYQEWDIPYDPDGGPGTWKWPDLV